MEEKYNQKGCIVVLKDGRLRGKIKIEGKTYQMYGKTKGEINEKFDRLKEKLKNNIDFTKSKMTVGECCILWLEEYAKLQLRANTYEKNRFFINKRIIPSIGKIRLELLTSLDIQHMVNSILKDGLQPVSVRCIKNSLHAILEFAVSHNIILKNPCNKNVKIKNAQSKPVQPLTEEQYNDFLAAAKKRAHYLTILLIATTALRREEACAIKWQDFNWSQGLLIIQRTVVRTHGAQTAIGDTKNLTSRRAVPLLQFVIDAFKAEYEKVKDEKNIEDKFVFQGLNNGPVNPIEVYRSACRTGKSIGIAKMNVHRLRHTVASILLARGENPKIVQELLGHATIEQTMHTYSHLIPGLKEKAIQKIANVIHPQITENI